MTKKQRGALIVSALKAEYPDNELITLDFDPDKPFQLLFATRLAAQCTDIRVNKVTDVLFKEYPALEDYAAADVKAVEKIVRPCGLGPTKARDIVGAAQMLISDFGGIVPDNMEDLLKLPGIGRKTANVVLGDIYKKPVVVVDTHCLRLSNLLGLVKSKNPEIVERELSKIIDPAESNDFSHRLVIHGRAVCVARRPQCENCCVYEYCLNSPLKKEKTKK